VQGFLASPRRRRRLVRVGLLAVALATVAGIAIWEPGGVDPPKTAAPVERTPPTLTRPRSEPYTPLRLTAAERRRIDATVDRFVDTAVVRDDLGTAWELASPEMREGISRGDWERGELPVLPYPAKAIAAVDWELGYVDGDAVVVDVMIQPRRASGERVQVYSVQLSRAGGGDERWLVDSWIPTATLGGDQPRTRPTGEAPRAIPPLAFDDARLSPWWFLVPAFFLALMVVTPVVLVLRGVRTRRRAERAYREWTAG
jgi:hypothetical protein